MALTCLFSHFLYLVHQCSVFDDIFYIHFKKLRFIDILSCFLSHIKGSYMTWPFMSRESFKNKYEVRLRLILSVPENVVTSNDRVCLFQSMLKYDKHIITCILFPFYPLSLFLFVVAYKDAIRWHTIQSLGYAL